MGEVDDDLLRVVRVFRGRYDGDANHFGLRDVFPSVIVQIARLGEAHNRTICCGTARRQDFSGQTFGGLDLYELISFHVPTLARTESTMVE
jgi:hypothetical protein